VTPTPSPRDAEEAPDLERRLQEVVAVIERLAALQFDARATVGPDGNIVDAVAAGVNALGEELAASYHEIERRVADRTAELAVATAELSHRALHDALTGQLNRAAFWDRLGHRLAQAGCDARGLAVLFLDLDDFKLVNDTLGHAAGDELLVEVARRIKSELRPGDTVARVGGDEFLVLLDEVTTPEAALAVAERVNARLREPYRFETQWFRATCSIGMALGTDRDTTCDALVAAADAAMYDAKRAGGGKCVLYRGPGAP
jgi:diguanylate cyclase (GGDEF)-like protein